MLGAKLSGLLGSGDPKIYSECTCYEDYAGENVSDHLIGIIPPLLQRGSYGSGSLTYVALGIINVVILVLGLSGCIANVTVGIAIVIVSMGDRADSLTNIALGITGVSIGMGDLASFFTYVALGVAGVGIGVGDLAGLLADIAIGVAAVVIDMLAGVGGRTAGRLLGENGKCAYAEKSAEHETDRKQK